MSGPEFHLPLRPLLLVLILGLLAGCEWLLEEPMPRTNPRDENAAVYYFRATPQYNGAAFDQTRLTWKWSAEDPHNPGRVTILRKEGWYPGSLSDSGADLVYQGQTDSTEELDSFVATQLGTTWYYTLFCEIDGYDEVFKLPSPPTVFQLNTFIDLPSVIEGSVRYDGTVYTGYGTLRLEDKIGPYSEALGFMAPDIGQLPGLNIDIYNVDIDYTIGTAGTGFVIQRILKRLPDEGSDELFFNLLKDPAYYTSADEVVETAPLDGQIINSAEFAALLGTWLDTLEIYGFRLALTASGTTEIHTLLFTIDYVGPPPL